MRKKNDPAKKKQYKKTSFAFKRKVVAEILNGRISANYASKKYDISRACIYYWMKKLTTFEEKEKIMDNKEELKKLKERIEDLEAIKDYQQDLIVEFERVTGKELSKKFLPKQLAEEIRKKKKKLK